MGTYGQESCSLIGFFSVSNKDIQSLNFLSPIVTIELSNKKNIWGQLMSALMHSLRLIF